MVPVRVPGPEDALRVADVVARETLDLRLVRLAVAVRSLAAPLLQTVEVDSGNEVVQTKPDVGVAGARLGVENSTVGRDLEGSAALLRERLVGIGAAVDLHEEPEVVVEHVTQMLVRGRERGHLMATVLRSVAAVVRGAVVPRLHRLQERPADHARLDEPPEALARATALGVVAVGVRLQHGQQLVHAGVETGRLQMAQRSPSTRQLPKRQNSDHEFTIWPTTMALWTLTSISMHQALPIGTTKGREGVVGLYLVAMGVVGAMACPDGAPKRQTPKFRPRIHNLAYHNGIMDFDIDLNASGTAHWYHKRKGGRRRSLYGGHGGCWRHGVPRWGAKTPKFRPRIHNLAYHNCITDFDIDLNASGTAHWYHKRKGGRRRSLSGGHGGCWRHGVPRWGAKTPKFRPRIHNLAYHNGIMDFEIDPNAPGTAHWYTTKGREGVVGLYLVAMGVVGAMAWCPDGAPKRQNSDHEFTIWPTTMALWTLTSIPTHQALPIGTTKGREGVVGLFLVAMGAVGAMACPDGAPKRQNSDHTNSQFGLPQWHYGL